MKQFIEEIFEVNPDLGYLRGTDVYFFPFKNIRRLVGITTPLFDKIFLFGNFDRFTTIFVIAHEFDHKDYQHKNGFLRTFYTMLFNRPFIEKRAVKRGFSTLRGLSSRYPEIKNYLRWASQKIKNYELSRNPIKKLFYNLYFDGVEV